jgi:hypothetical protein
MQKFIAWLFAIKPEHLRPTYYHCYGEGAHAQILGDGRNTNPYTYGTIERDSWDDGWSKRK